MGARKIGILGGTLDPVHNGHLAIAAQATALLGLDGVMLLPAGDPPHKRVAVDKADRLRMAEIAADAQAGLFASDVEIVREGVTYTVDTLTALRVERPDVEWVYIVGADTLNVIDQWREFERVARLCGFAAAGRPGCDMALTALRADALRARYGARIELLTAVGPDISSTEIRRRVAAGESIEGLVPAGVAAYIQAQGLYLCDWSEARILERLRAELTPHRYRHTLGVAETARRLAARCGVEPCRARLAGLLHDCAKSMPLEAMRALVLEAVPDADPAELETRSVLHAPAGSAVAAREYGVLDPAILRAIRRHTLGGPDMSAMDALIYVADFIEPSREPFPGLEKARALAEEDIFRALRLCAELTAAHLRDQGQAVHPRTLDMLNTLNERTDERGG